jgi:hypothetical protein
MLRHYTRGFRAACAALAALAALAVSAAAFAFNPPPFPRLAGIEIGGRADYNDPAYQDALARLSLMILEYWPGLRPGGQSMDSIVRAIKAQNPDALVFLYTNSDEQYLSREDARSSLRDKINAMKWWLYSGPGHHHPVPAFYGHDMYTINNTPFTPRDADGDDSVDYIAKWYVDNYYTPNPDIDGFFMDNVFVQPRVAGDWQDDHVVLQASDPNAAAALQAGYEAWFARVRALMPGKYQLGNLGSWAINGAAVPPGYIDMVNGGTLEAAIGKPYSPESLYGWQAMMLQYDTDMSVVSEPKLVIFNQWGSPSDYQAFRYGFASCLMNDGYYSFTSNSDGYHGVVWFDEYNARLGQPLGPPPTSAWQNGVWRRDFADGIALVNPKGNGPQTVTLGGTFVKLDGTQDPQVNSGQRVTTVTLRDRDGLILLRPSPLLQPMPPTQFRPG